MSRPSDARTPPSLSEPERIVYRVTPAHTEGREANAARIVADARPELEAWESRLERWLERNGYYLPGAVLRTRLALTLLAITLFLVAGFVKIALRPQGAPIGFLLFLMIAGSLLLWWFRPKAKVTAAAREALQSLKEGYSGPVVRERYLDAPDGVEPMLVGVAVVGGSVLLGSELAGLQSTLVPPPVVGAPG